jgi:hypothetical protein
MSISISLAALLEASQLCEIRDHQSDAWCLFAMLCC